MRALAEIEADLRALACSDGGCLILRPTGMVTNGGCHCLDAWESDYRETLRRAGKALVLHQERATAIRADERAKVEAECEARIVAWLREVDEAVNRNGEGRNWSAYELAADIERGEYQAKGGG